MQQTRSSFFAGPVGPTGILFRQYNHPTENTFIDLFDSVLFKLESGDRATLSTNGHARIAAAANIVSRSDTYMGVVATHFAMASHLPNTLATITANHAILATDTANGIIVDQLSYSSGGAVVRSDFRVRSDVTMASTGGSIAITEAPAGSKHFNLEVDPAWTDAFKVMCDVADGSPHYLEDCYAAGTFTNIIVGPNHYLEINFDNVMPITLSQGGLGLQAELEYNNIGLETGALGVQIRDNIDTIAFTTTYVRTAGNQTIAGLKQFTTYPQWSGAYVAPTIDNELAPKKYIDDLHLLNVNLAGAQIITGTKEFNIFPFKTGPYHQRLCRYPLCCRNRYMGVWHRYSFYSKS
jgi:hypothetical protein